jgi:hypothetical protein
MIIEGDIVMSFADSMQDLERTNINAEAVVEYSRPTLIERIAQFFVRSFRVRSGTTRPAA